MSIPGARLDHQPSGGKVSAAEMKRKMIGRFVGLQEQHPADCHICEVLLSGEQSPASGASVKRYQS